VLLPVALALLASGCSSGDSAASQIGISPEAFTKIVEGDEDFLSPATERQTDAWIGYVDGDQVVRIGDGGSIPVGDLDIEFHVVPFPPTEFDVSVELLVTGPGGKPAEVDIEAWYDMVFMTHGQPIAEVEALGGGRYRMPLDLFMFGPWVVKTTIRSEGSDDELPLVIYVWPNV
jgi:hypothetical protein